MKVFFRTIHLYLSLAAGLVILCSCITGTMLVFEKEINHALHPQHYFVKPGRERLPLAVLKDSALKWIPKAKLAAITVYNDPERAVEIGVNPPEKKGKKDKQSGAGTQHNKRGPAGAKAEKPRENRAGLIVFVNPYTGQVLGKYSKRESFLSTIEMLHRFLLAGKNSAGDMIVGISTLFFLFILITGVILWWPKTKNIMRQRLKIKFDSSGKRLTHDLHVVTGFYTSIFLIVIVITGLIMSFDWANKALFYVTGSPMKKEDTKPPVSAYLGGLKPLTVEAALQTLNGKIQTAQSYNIRTPRDSAGTYSVNILPNGAMESAIDSYAIDQYSGKILTSELFTAKSLGQRVRAYVKPVHTGAIYGLPTKILSFIICLLACIFPVTGVMMWINRIGKKNPKIKKKRPAKTELGIA